MVDNEDDVDWESSVRWTAESPDLLALCISFTRDLWSESILSWSSVKELLTRASHIVRAAEHVYIHLRSNDLAHPIEGRYTYEL